MLFLLLACSKKKEIQTVAVFEIIHAITTTNLNSAHIPPLFIALRH